MLRTATAGLLCLALIPAAYAAPNCAGSTVSQPLPLPATVIAPAAAEFYTRSVQLGMPTGVLAQPYTTEQSVDRVLLRLRVEGCQDLAKVIPPGGTVNPNDPAAYKATTAFDNTPWRFDMSQNGKRMTAEEFDAWMKARGVRVVKARPVAAPAPAAAATPTPAADAKSVENK
ncbi:hypothetical protein [Xanthomonas arboricola]|uniref:hypothetical protein n=1 Tax=Xanthomonas arboricola TaxID=56448 RepID=UPI00063EBAEB|nr:hypothetical protein [Xanthomonas arboricola]MBB3846850.1 hypothetical protein [Xanthomonas arboricola]PPT20686.1 hypothetical protein XarbCFBP7629_12785 [Xanthomonas arboricola]